MTYSLQLYTVRKPLEDDLAGTIAKVAAIGFTNVEPYNFVATADELASALKANGLAAPSGHAPLLRADQDEIFAAANKLGIETVIDPHVDSSQWNTEEDIKATAAALNAAAVKGAGYGVRVGYHNHEFELEAQINGRSGLEILAENLNPEVVLEVDTYWAAVGGEDPVELLKRLGDRVRFIHIKDGPLTKVDKDQVAVGSGKVPVWDVISAASALEVGVVELDDFTGDIFEAVTDSLNYLKAGKK
ncbi:sugar phosphate isomerase/epimerase [Arthrobacter livingstonensis]|uniref:Sugar phosphate isomerase/epimerase n=1 Tax=Arthrobacter livingstonensis TaxID=670078 RepID=A0A2V5LFR1_9MICC|nr:sugar phosphate isomerase/epimerase [Arthrobacter livingstonensis]PYI69634.1 sugar phosphate isomerase/epimerase [Arthrobacter livingstonensis]